MTQTPVASPASQAGSAVDFGISDPVVPVELWQRDTTNHFEVAGTLTYHGQPVAGARLASNAYVLPAPTGADGSFTVKGDKTLLDRNVVTVRSLDGATIGGQQIPADAERDLINARATIETAYMTTLDGGSTLIAGEANQVVSGTLTFADGTTPIPPVKLWGYELTGTLLDTDGAPIAGSFVSIRDDEGETWSLSTATGDDGTYVLRFYPVGGAQFILRVAEGQDSYQSEQDASFADNSSATMDIVLDRATGTVMGTGEAGAFAPETVAGAEYVGYMAGLAIGDQPIDAVTTWPDTSGAFTITIPTVERGATLTFFQARLRFFSSTAIEPGAEIDPAIVPTPLDPRIPNQLEPSIEVAS